MNRLIIPLFLAAACLSGCTWDDWGTMTRQPKVLPYRESDFYADERAMQAPPEGTVPWETRTVKYEWRQSKDDKGKWVDRIPVPITADMLLVGREKFEIHCATCHGLVGNGYSLPAENMGARPPPSLVDLPPHPPGYFYGAISEGFGYMGSYASQLSVTERWSVVAYLDVLKHSQRASLDDAPSSVKEQLMKEAK